MNSSALTIEAFMTPWNQRNPRFPLVFTTDRTDAIRDAHGLFFAVGEIVTGDAYARKKIMNLLKSAEANYYGNDEDAFFPAERFEQALAGCNREYALLSATERIAHELQAFHALVGVLRGKELWMAAHGNVGAFLYRTPQSAKRAPAGQFIDILSNYGGPKNEPGQLFTQIVQGTFDARSALLFAGPAILELFSPDRIAKLFATRSPHDVLAHLQKSMVDIPGMEGGVLLFTVDLSKPAIARAIAAGGASHSSLERMLRTESKTKALLAPTLRRDVQKGFSRAGTILQIVGAWTAAHGRKAAEKISTRRARRNGSDRSLRIAQFIPSFDPQKIKGILAHGKKQVFRAIGQWYKGVWRAVLRAILLAMFAVNGRLRRLPPSSRILLLVVLLLSIGLAASIGILSRNRGSVAPKNTLIAQIEEKRDSAEASLIYKQEDKAFAFISEAERLLADLPRKSKKEKEIADALTQKIDETKQKLRKEISVEPALIADLGTQIPPAEAEGLAGDTRRLFAIGTQEIFRVSTSEKKATPFPISLGGDTVAQVRIGDKEILILTSRGTLLGADPQTGETTPLEITFPESGVQITDMQAYGKRLYAFSKKTRQIFKHDRTTSGFGRGAPWVKTGTEALSDGERMAIDGNIYISGPRGIQKFFTGAPQNFTPLAVDPAISNIRALWTDEDSGYLYVLEAKRIVALDKTTGKLIAQYVSPEFSDLKDLMVRENEKRAYLLQNRQVLAIPLGHLK